MAMSEEDRKRIMEEHEKQMVAMENSLALGKLRSRRLLEEKLAARKSRQLQKLEQEHQEEAKVSQGRILWTICLDSSKGLSTLVTQTIIFIIMVKRLKY